MITAQNHDLQRYLRDAYDPASLAQVRERLETEGTLKIPVLPTGLFSAATVHDFSKGTNYHAAWVRDNVHVAYAHAVNGRPEVAVRDAKALATFFKGQRARFDAIIEEPSRKSIAMDRPHVRFDGDSFADLKQDWSHAQNDALGYFVWLYSTLALDGAIPARDLDVATLARFPRYFRAIAYWSDQDSGHWEEGEKTSASSIGVVVAGLRKLRELARGGEGAPLRSAVAIEELDDLIARGEAALSRILPAECDDPDPKKNRPYDAALLFLIYPLAVVDDAMAAAIVARIEQHLRGPIGIKRYLGDSFYCTDYEFFMKQRGDDPTRDFSKDMAARDALLTPGGEAQWCVFDPILSVYYGRLYRRDRSPEGLRKQTEYLNRSLAQVTRANPPRYEAFQCPELYYIEEGRLQTSKSTPLLWTQANLWTALEAMRRSLEG